MRGCCEPRWFRVLWIIVGLVLLAELIAWPVTAWADGFDLCKDAPAPVAPKSGMAGMLTTRPDHIPATTRDPFTDPNVPVGQVYGYNWTWANYDLGCGNDFLRDPIAVANTQSANVGAGILGAGIATLAGLEHLASDSQIGWLTTIVTNVAGSLRGLLLGDGGRHIGWLPLAVLALGVVVVFRARRADYAGTARTLCILAVAAGLSVFALLTPTVASKTVDEGVTGLASVAGASFGGSASDTVNRQAGYRTWLAGYFGDPDSPLANQYGPELMWATHYSWAETVQIEHDPTARKTIDRAKAKQFKQIASAVEDTSPAAYQVFTGRGDRTGPVLLGMAVLVCAGLFASVAFVMILLSRVMMQGLVVAAPIAAVAGILPPGHAVLARMWDLFAAGLVAVVKFTLAAGVMSLVLGGLAAAEGMPGVEKLCWMIIATVVGLVLTKPARTFKTIMPGLDPNQHYLRGLAGKAMTALAVSEGVSIALDHDNNSDKPAPDQPADPTPTAHVRRPELPPPELLPPLPAPTWVQVDDQPTPTPATQVRQAAVMQPDPQPTAVPGRQWAGILDPSPAGEAAPRHAPLPLPAGPAAIEETGLPAPTRTETAEPKSTDDVSPGAAGRDAHVVSPSGVIIPADPTLYRSGGGPLPGDQYVRLPEPETDNTGNEHDMITYHSPRQDHRTRKDDRREAGHAS